MLTKYSLQKQLVIIFSIIAIGVLAIIMLLTMKFHIPEAITGLIGISLIILSVWSSIKFNKSREAK